MNKAELIDQVAEKLGSDRRQATAAVEHVVDTIVRAVHKGENVTITGFEVALETSFVELKADEREYGWTNFDVIKRSRQTRPRTTCDEIDNLSRHALIQERASRSQN